MNGDVSKPKFGTDGWRGIIGEDFNSLNCFLVANSLLKLSSNIKKVVIGYDTRKLSEEISQKIKNFYSLKGIDVLLSDCPIPTPTVSFSVKNTNSDFGIVITASHNSKIWNGIKIKNKYGQSISEKQANNLTSIISKEKISEEDFKKFDAFKSDQNDSIDLMSDYIESIKNIVDIEKIKSTNLNIAVDCMFGTSSLILKKLLQSNKCNVEEINATNDSSFPGIKQPEPIDENLSELKLKVKQSHADIGFAFDADSDRVGVIDNKSNYIEAPYTFCVIIDHVLGNKKIVKNISTTVSMTSMIDSIVKKYGVNCFRTKVGFKYVAPNMEKNDSILGGEESGGYSYSKHLLERDGIISSMLILENLIESKSNSSEFIYKLSEKYGNYFYRRSDIKLNDKTVKKLTDFISKFNSKKIIDKQIKFIDKKDGIKINFENDEWILVRLSGTEPLARIYAESFDKESVNNLISSFLNYFNL